ncbi:hypothetical protein [Rhizosphaericola mali]|uniref:Uncharacterized protein n=1 Tax=Rhizosphaericola mali TaxID=2545455 RepID=A0A5P2G1Q4_9BACT|nr:hypothetical protein [Rhizosphaericola mali]QES89736.1 hypothetical protein E0W69_014055 [Rhizosphaericola mali]
MHTNNTIRAYIENRLYSDFFNDYSLRSKDSSSVYFISLAIYNSKKRIDSVTILNTKIDSGILKYVDDIRSHIIKYVHVKNTHRIMVYNIFLYYDYISPSYKNLINEYDFQLSWNDLVKMQKLETDKNVVIAPNIILRIPTFSKVN